MTEAKRIKSIREALGMNQSKFAEVLGVRQGSLSDIERGRHGQTLSSNVKQSLQNLFNVNLDYLLHGEGEMFQKITPDVVVRIGKVMEYYNLTPELLANRIGYHRGDIRERFIKMIEDGIDPPLEMINQVCKTYPDINRNYILTGVGTLLEHDTATQTGTPELDAIKETLATYKKLTTSYEQRIADLEDTINSLKQK